MVSGLILASAVLSGIVQASTDISGIQKPSIPEFTVKFVNASYTVTITNSYTGLDETKQISNNSIEIKITNQPFDYSDYKIYFNLRVKPRFADNWTEVYPLRTFASSYEGDYNFSHAEYINDYSKSQSNSSYTLIVFSVVPTELYLGSGYDVEGTFLSAIPDGSQLDFQVEALVGHPSQRWVSDHALYPWLGGGYTSAVAYDETSGWSNTQTVTIGESQTPTPSPATTPTSTSPQEPQQTEQAFIIGVAIAAAVIVAGLGLLIYLIKRK
jgi:hypothetical protein